MTHFHYSDKDVFGIHNRAEKYTWTAYFIFVVISSVIGDMIILLAAIKFQAFKLHKFIVIIIEHMAVCDLIVSLIYVLPTIISLIADRWVLGESLCFTNPYTYYYFNQANMLFICVMTSSKLFLF